MGFLLQEAQPFMMELDGLPPARGTTLYDDMGFLLKRHNPYDYMMTWANSCKRHNSYDFMMT